MESSFSILYTQAFRTRPVGLLRGTGVSHEPNADTHALPSGAYVAHQLFLPSSAWAPAPCVIFTRWSPPGTQQPPETQMTQFYSQNWPGFGATFASPCGSQRPAFFLPRRAAAATRRQLLAGWQGPGLGQQGRAWRPGCLRGFAPRPPPAP